MCVVRGLWRVGVWVCRARCVDVGAGVGAWVWACGCGCVCGCVNGRGCFFNVFFLCMIIFHFWTFSFFGFLDVCFCFQLVFTN